MYPGRRTGRTYQTPVNVFRRGNQFVFVLTYGQSQWVKNVLAAGGCHMRHMGHDIHLVNPEVIVDPEMRLLPKPVRLVARIGRVTELFRMSPAEAATGS